MSEWKKFGNEKPELNKMVIVKRKYDQSEKILVAKYVVVKELLQAPWEGWKTQQSGRYRLSNDDKWSDCIPNT